MGTFRNGVVAALAAAACAGSVEAGPVMPLSAFDIVYQPRPRAYAPDTSDNIDDVGKVFVVECTVGRTGHMEDCHAEDNDIYDEGFVDAAVADISRWVVARQLKSGESSEGLSFEVKCWFREQKDA